MREGCNLEKEYHIMVPWQDARLRAAAEFLQQAGCQMTQQPQQAEAFLLPLPLGADRPGLAELFASARPGTLILAGRIDPAVAQLPRAARVELLDYSTRPELAEKNAVPTAEGCIALLMEHSDQTIWQRKILVIGFGRVGRVTAQRLLALGAKVTVAARNPSQRAMAEGLGCTAVPLEALDCPGNWTSVVNTVPTLVLDRTRLEQLPSGCLIVDLASKPGGTDFAAAQQMGLAAIHALALPGRCTPATAGRFLGETVLAILHERSGRS